MESFEELFVKSEGQLVEYKGKLLIIKDIIKVNHGDHFKIVLEQFNSNWKQGVSLTIPKGSIRIKGKEFKKGIVLWQDTAPRENKITIVLNNINRTEELHIFNIWDVGDGIMDFGHNGAAMMIEELPDGSKRYFCNDAYPDDDLNDIVFTVKKIEQVEQVETKNTKIGFIRKKLLHIGRESN